MSGSPYDFTSPVDYLVSGVNTYTVTVTVDPQLLALPVGRGLACWFDAGVGVTDNGSGVIQTWSDLSGKAHHGQLQGGAPTLVADALNSRPAAQFRSAYLALAMPLTVKEQYLVVRSPAATWNGGAVLGWGGDRNYLFGDTGFDQDPFPSGVSKDGTVVSFEPRVGRIAYHLGTITDWMLLKITSSMTPTGTFMIGSTAKFGGLERCNCDVAEIIGYDSVLSSAEEQLVGAYLSNKYGLSTAYLGGGYGTWASANAGGQAANLDYNNDGVANGIAYFMGVTGIATNPGLDGTNTVTWPVSATYSGTYEVQTSADLSNWIAVDPQPEVVGGDLTYALPEGLGKQFIRLLVTPTP